MGFLSDFSGGRWDKNPLSVFADPIGIFQQPDLPQQPDWIGVAEAEAQGNLDLARYQTQANRPNEYNPYGSRTWEQDPNNPDMWSARTTLSDNQQNIFDTNEATDLSMARLGRDAASNASDLFNTRFTIDGSAPTYQGNEAPLEQYGSHRQNVVNAMMARSDTDIARDRETKRSELIAQGIPVGSEAYNREMEMLDRKQTDARQQAEIAAEQMASTGYNSMLSGRAQQGREANDAFGAGMEGHRQSVTDALLQRQTPLNEMNAFRQASQVQVPNFGSYGQMGLTNGPDLTGAAENQFNGNVAAYNAQNQQTQNNRNTALGLGSAALSFFSDERLKENIKEVGKLESGLKTYEFNFIGDDQKYVGVLAQEAKEMFPDSVSEHESGYLMVDYGGIQ